MVNLKDQIIRNPDIFRQFKVNETLLAEYLCFQEKKESQIWTHQNYLAYTVKGKKGIKVPGKTFYTNAGDAIFIKKGVHSTLQFFEEQYIALIIFLPDDFIKSVVERSSVPGYTKINGVHTNAAWPLEVDDMLSIYFNSLLEYFSQSRTPARQLLENKFEELIIHILHGTGNQSLAQQFRWVQSVARPSIREVMEANFRYNLNLEEFARLAHRSLSTFRRDFNKLYNITPGKWLTNRRLEYGKYLLETTDYSIAEITRKSGFENTSHFIRIFKERYNASPSQYKRLV